MKDSATRKSARHEDFEVDLHFPSPLQSIIEHVVTDARGYDAPFTGRTPTNQEQLVDHLYQMDDQTRKNSHAEAYMRAHVDALPKQKHLYLSPQDRYLHRLGYVQQDLEVLERIK